VASRNSLVPYRSGALVAADTQSRLLAKFSDGREIEEIESFFRRYPRFFEMVVLRHYPLTPEKIEQFTNVTIDLTDLAHGPYCSIGNIVNRRPDERRQTILWRRSGEWVDDLLFGGAYFREHARDDKGLNIELSWELEDYVDRRRWETLSANRFLPWSEELIEEFVSCWDWKLLERNRGLLWSEALIDKFSDRWDWDELSLNEALPWSEALIDRFADRWDWRCGSPVSRQRTFFDFGGLSWNPSIPWTRDLLARYSDWLNMDVVAEHFDGGVTKLPPERVDALLDELFFSEGRGLPSP
jgi:hypothetical protein